MRPVFGVHIRHSSFLPCLFFMYVLVLSARYDEAKMAIADSGRFSLKLL